LEKTTNFGGDNRAPGQNFNTGLKKMVLLIAMFGNEGYKTGLLNFSNFSRLGDEF